VFETPPGGQLTARIVLARMGTEVSGTVVSDGQAAGDVDVVIFPEDAARWTYPSRLVRVTRTDASGRFRVTALPPARYLAVAVDYLEEGEEYDTEVLDRLRSRAVPVAVARGATPPLDLVLVGR
jgi:hypothetical protein